MVARCLSRSANFRQSSRTETIFIAASWWVELGRRHNYGDYGGENCLQQIIISQTSAGGRKSGNIGRMAAQKDFNSVITEIKVFRLVIGRAELH